MCYVLGQNSLSHFEFISHPFMLSCTIHGTLPYILSSDTFLCFTISVPINDLYIQVLLIAKIGYIIKAYKTERNNLEYFKFISSKNPENQ